jgi:hypothetical protein
MCATAPPSLGFDRAFRVIALLILAAGFALHVYASSLLRGLYGDGPDIFVRMAHAGTFVFFEPARYATQFVQQLPTVLAMKWGMTDLIGLTMLYSLSMELLPILFTAGCYALLPRGEKALFIFPLIHYLAGAEAAAFEPLVEGPAVTAYFWFLLFLIVFRAKDSVTQLMTCAAAVPAVFSHEVMVFLAPVLAIASMLRARAETIARSRVMFRLLAAWFGIVTAAQLGFTLFPASPENRAYFIASSLAMRFVAAPLEGVNVPMVLGMLALVLLAALLGMEGRAAKTWWHRVSWFLIVAFGAICLGAVAATTMTAYFFAPHLQFYARNYSAVLSLPLAGILLAYGARPKTRFLATRPTIVALLTCLALGQFGWHVVALGRWTDFLDHFRSVLTSHRGIVTLREAEESGLRPIAFLWAYPSLSIVLSPGGKVASMISPSEYGRYRPFDPANPQALPRSKLFDTSSYRDALRSTNGN